ncbi:uncharacterized protein E0L32_006782 [Thyridium curvatum]|uniref:Acid phosphatase n=1 Tax=Thyridium curvatum TaxID=1093900 RepID=A0A507ASD1_9PEZI|nr:uncharacterized protein E0L32_006782 [Thyridium curvatum]TPX12902.1 hypothetical protein E0L32_006782 [Thyridium curvatum]
MKPTAAGLLLAGLAVATASPTTTCSTNSSTPSAPKGKWFDRFVVIVLENTNRGTTFGDPYFLNLTNMGMYLDNYHGTTHPSQPNYITMVTNSIAAGVFNDDDHNTTEYSIIDLMEPKGVTWKAYMEGYSPLANGECNPVSEIKETLYVRKHNPFMSFDNIRNNTRRCQNIVNAEQHFAKDVALGAGAPNYMYYSPNLDNDAHNTNISFAAKDIQYLVDTMLNNKEFMKGTMILITFDENMIYLNTNYGQPNAIYSLLLGNDTIKCYSCVDQQYYNHFTQLVTLENNWNLGNIPNGGGWDTFWRPFGQLRSKTDDICAYAPCSEYPDGKSPPPADADWNDQNY